jgi:hypothetical protein
VGHEFGQADADVAGAPAGVLLTEGPGQVVGLVRVWAASGTGSVGGLEVVGLAAKALQEVAHGAFGQVQGVGNGGRVLPLLGVVKDETAEREGEWCWHENPRKRRSGCTIA